MPLLSGGRYFRGAATFEGPLVSELYGTLDAQLQWK